MNAAVGAPGTLTRWVWVSLLILWIVFCIVFAVVMGIRGERQRVISHSSPVEWLANKGFSPTEQNELLSLSKMQGSIGTINGSGSFFFGSGGVELSGSTRTASFLGFALITGNAGVSVLEVPFSKIDFSFDSEAVVPKVQFILQNHSIKNSELRTLSTSEILQNHLRSVKVTLSPDVFSREVAPLTFQQPKAVAGK